MDEVTGLHAFDHLDPVSALNVLPEAPESVAPPPRAAAAPRAAAPRENVRPPAPAFRGRSLPPPPPPRGGPAGVSVPPPPPMRSFAPPAVGPGDLAPARLSQPIPASSRPVPSPSSPSWAQARAVAQRPSHVTDDDLTQRVALNQMMPQGEFDDSDPTSVISMGQQGHVDAMNGLNPPRTSPNGHPDYSTTSVATSIDMDWDEDEEPQTNMRDELQPARASVSDFDQVVHVPATAPASYMPPAHAAARPSLMPQQNGDGAPSPFVRASSMTAVHSWEDDAETRVQAPIAVDPGLEAPWARPSSTTVDTMLDGDEEQPSKLRGGLPWLMLAGVLAVGLALGVRAMMAPPALATVTLVTQPADAEVSVDGRPLVGQTSPFTIQGLAPESEHSLVVRAEGHAEHTSRFGVEPGETKALSSVSLQPVKVDTGFAINSQPAGAKVFVDGKSLELETPARIADLAPGLHTVRLERGENFLPWETQVAVAVGQVIELESAQLVPVAAVEEPEARSSSRSGGEQARLERRERRAERRAERAAEKAAAQAAKRDARAAKAARSSAKSAVASKARVVKPAPVVAGGGTLRVNSRPWSQVFVDGKLVGNTPQLGISLAPGTHKLKLVSPDLGMTKQLTVKIEKGKATTKVVNLIE